MRHGLLTMSVQTDHPNTPPCFGDHCHFLPASARRVGTQLCKWCVLALASLAVPPSPSRVLSCCPAVLLSSVWVQGVIVFCFRPVVVFPFVAAVCVLHLGVFQFILLFNRVSHHDLLVFQYFICKRFHRQFQISHYSFFHFRIFNFPISTVPNSIFQFCRCFQCFLFRCFHFSIFQIKIFGFQFFHFTILPIFHFPSFPMFRFSVFSNVFNFQVLQLSRFFNFSIFPIVQFL